MGIDPHVPDGAQVSRLTQAIDIAPTFLDLHGVEPPPETEGMSLLREKQRAALIFGYFGGAVNVTDGRYTYHRYPDDLKKQEIYQYTVMPTHITKPFTPEELSAATLARPFSWTKDVPLLKVPVIERSPMFNNYGPGTMLENETRLYDLKTDPGQMTPLRDDKAEARMIALMQSLMQENDAPLEAFARLKLGGNT